MDDREDAATMGRFGSIDAYTIGDAARRHGTGGVVPGLRPQTSASRFVGRALTARIEYRPNADIPLSQYGGDALLDRVAPGDVVILDGAGHLLSALGDLAFAVTQRRGGVAVVVNAAVRDIEDADPAFPVFACGVAITSFAGRAIVTDVGEPVFINGVRIATGDIVAGCRGGVVTVPWADRGGVLKHAATMIETDRLVREGIAQGLTLGDLWQRHKKPTE